MVAGPATPPEEQPADEDAHTAQADSAPPATVERYGPLALARTRKDDGRALLLYSVAERTRA